MDFISLVLILIVISLFIHIIAYMIGKALSNEILLAASKSEFLEVLVSGIVISFILFLISPSGHGMSVADSVVGMVYTSILPSSAYDPSLSVRENFFRVSERLINKMSEDLNYSLIIYDGMTGISAYMKQFNVQVPSDVSVKWLRNARGTIQLNPCTAYGYIGMGISRIISTLLNGITILRVFNALVGLANYNFFVAFSLFGLLLRSIPLTRWAGNFLISMAIGLYIFVPISFILVDTIVNDFYASVGQPSIQPLYGELYDILENYPPKTRYDSIEICFLRSPIGRTQSVFSSYGSGNDIDMSRYVLYVYILLIARGFAVLVMISIIAGFMSIFGTRISPYVLSFLTRLK